jgi:ABC-type Fe3+ transport system permease subunit
MSQKSKPTAQKKVKTANTLIFLGMIGVVNMLVFTTIALLKYSDGSIQQAIVTGCSTGSLFVTASCIPASYCLRRKKNHFTQKEYKIRKLLIAITALVLVYCCTIVVIN